MRMKKWMGVLGLAAFMAVGIPGNAGSGLRMTAQAAGSGEAAGDVRVFDQADLFLEEEEKELQQAIDALREKMDMDAAVVTAEENPGSAKTYADDFYEAHGFGTGSGHDGALLLIDMDNRELCISTEGKMVRYMTDNRIEAVLDDMYGYAAAGDYYQAAGAFVEDLEVCYDNGIAADQYNYDSETGKISRYRSVRWYEALFALAAAAACGGFAVLGVVREYNMRDEESRMEANFKLSYRKDSAFRMGSRVTDLLIGSYVTQQVIASQDHRSSGRSGGGRSLSSGGRSTTHRSSSGRSHGGGSRKF